MPLAPVCVHVHVHEPLVCDLLFFLLSLFFSGVLFSVSVLELSQGLSAVSTLETI